VVYCSLYRYRNPPKIPTASPRNGVAEGKRPANKLITTRSILTVAVDRIRIAGDKRYRYQPRVNCITTPFTGVAVYAVDVLWTLLGLAVSTLPLVILACAEEASRF
jgi:hypothetical protein